MNAGNSDFEFRWRWLVARRAGGTFRLWVRRRAKVQEAVDGKNAIAQSPGRAFGVLFGAASRGKTIPAIRSAGAVSDWLRADVGKRAWVRPSHYLGVLLAGRR